MIGLLYLPLLAAAHFSGGAALGGMAVLAMKALATMRREDCQSQKAPVV